MEKKINQWHSCDAAVKDQIRLGVSRFALASLINFSIFVLLFSSCKLLSLQSQLSVTLPPRF
jgi:hypothetical protein